MNPAATTNSAVVDIRVIPRAGRPGVAGSRGGALLVRLNAPPVDGKANRELIELLAEVLNVPRRAVSIVAGARSRTKKVRVDGVSAHYVSSKFNIESND